MGSVAIVDGVAYRFIRDRSQENWDRAFQLSDEGRGWIEAYKRRGENSPEAYTQTNGNKITVIDEDFPLIKSGALYVKARANYRVSLRVRIDKGNYWNDGGFLRTPAPGRFNTGYASFGPFNFSDAFIVLESGDYISVDIDGDYADIAQFKVVQGGKVVFNGDAINRNVSLTIDEVQQLTLIQDEVEGPLEGGGIGDIDGDGVIDSEDFDPNDPDIQNPGDIDDDPDDFTTPDEPIIVYDPEDISGDLIYVSPNFPPDPFPILGYAILGAFFVAVLRRRE